MSAADGVRRRVRHLNRGGSGLRRLQQHFEGLEVAHSYEGRPVQLMADGRGVSIVQQTGLLTATILAPCASVVIRLSFVILPGVDDVLILGATILMEQVNIGGVQGLTTKAICRAAPGALVTSGTPPGKREAAGAVSFRRLSVHFVEVQIIAN